MVMNVKEPKIEVEEEDFSEANIDNLCEDLESLY